MNNMFYNCTSLVSIDLSNLNTQSLNELEYMFYFCDKLNYIDISNFIVENDKI